MGFCRRCGDIVSGERCKCGGAAVAPVVSWKDHDAEANDKWSRTYVLRDRSASLSASRFKGNTKSASTSLPADLSARVSAHIVAVASVDPQAAVPLKPTVTGPAPEVGILPSPSDSTLSKVYGSVLQPKESLATFSCWVCGDVFPPDATIYPDPRTLDSASANRFLCRGCFVDNGGTKGTCPTCSRPVLTLKSEGGFVHSTGKYWHKRCFNCNECQKNIGDAPLVDLLGRPSCPECFDSCLRRPSERDQAPSTPTKLMRHSPIARRNLGGIETTTSMTTQLGSNSREASPALEELEQRLGIVRNTREGSPSLEELSQKLSSIGKEPSRARRDSRHSERFRSPEPEDVFSSSPERASGLRYSTGTPSPVRRQTTESNGNSSPAPTPEAIEEMKSRFMKSATASSPSMPSPLNHLAQSFTTIFPSQFHTPSRTRSSSSLPAPTPSELADETQDQDVKGITDENDVLLSLVRSPTDLPTPDLISDASDDTAPLSPSAELQLCGSQRDAKLSTVNQHDEIRHSDTESDSRESTELDTHEKRVSLGAPPIATEQTGSDLTTSIDTPSKKVDINMTPPSKIPVARKSLGTKVINQAATPASMVMPASSSTARCTKCAGLLFTDGEGRYLTLPAEEGAKSKMYHVECFRCAVCEGTFEEGGNGQATFVKAHGGPCHVECAPPERHVVRKSTSPKSNYVKSAVAASEKTTETRTSISRTAAPSTSKTMNPLHSSSRYEPPTLNKPSNISPNPGTLENTRFGCRTVCSGCNISVSPMERGVVPGPQGTRWHATCLVCGGKKRKEAIAQQKSALWIVGRGGFDERRNGKPGCGKKLDSAAKTDGGGGVWCRECLLLLGPSSPLSPSSTGTSKGVASQHTGTTIAKQFTGLGSTSESGKESGLLKQLTGGGLSPTRSISPTKQMGGSFWSGASASGRPRPKSVIGIRSTKSTDEGRGMYLVRQMTGNSPVAREV